MHFIHISVNVAFIFMQLTINKPTSRYNQSLDCGIFHHHKSNHVCSTQAWGLNLNPHNTLILWQGYSGTKLQAFPIAKNRTSSSVILIIHCRGNSVGQTTAKKLLKVFFLTLSQIYALFPTTTVILPSSLHRFTKRFSNNVKTMETIRGRMNRDAINSYYLRVFIT